MDIDSLDLKRLQAFHLVAKHGSLRLAALRLNQTIPAISTRLKRLEEELGVPVVAVDYDNIQAVAKTLEDNEVHTVISTILMMPGPSGEAPKEIELIRAADASKTTKRIMSSDWGSPHTPE